MVRKLRFDLLRATLPDVFFGWGGSLHQRLVSPSTVEIREIQTQSLGLSTPPFPALTGQANDGAKGSRGRLEK